VGESNVGESYLRMKNIRVWKTYSILDWWFKKHSSAATYICALDYMIWKDSVRCEYLNP
jgi:hypothetical protein